MSNLVIVAIPAEDDYVHKISTEKVPHMTLLFLGDVENKPVSKIADFLQHAVNILELGPFGLEVERRGVLGPDEADVLFFRKDPWALKRIAEFRGQLLKNTPIKSAYDSVTQYPEWTPHLTLGYPPTPAREDKRDYPGIRWVEFDKIGLWTGDYEGEEFQLVHKYNYDLAEMAMSATAGAGRAFLKHYGIKGMKWGVRSADRKAARAQRSSDRHDRILNKLEGHLERTSKPGEIAVKERLTVGGKTRLKAEGGERHPAHEDAVKVATSRQKLKKSGAAALSNRELAEVAQRLDLEQRVKQLDSGTASGGKKFVRGLLGTQAKQQTGRVANEFATREVNRRILKKS